MNVKQHWTPRFIYNRIREYVFRKLNPSAPWLTPKAIKFLDHWLTREKSGMELGSGRSTIWIAQRCKHIISIESDISWYNEVRKLLHEKEINNTTYIFAPLDDKDDVLSSPYLNPLRESANESFDFILVDGDYRGYAALLATSKVRSGGLLIVDNANWFLPSKSLSPSSVKLNEKCKSEEWEEFSKQVKGWETTWTSNGVTDTALFFKP